MPLSQRKPNQGRSKALQSKLANFASPSASNKARAGSQAMDTDEANASSTPEDTMSDTNNATTAGQSNPTPVTVLEAIKNMKTEFSHQV